MDGYFYKNIQTKKYDKDDYIKSLKEKISVLKAQIRILKADNNRLINEIEKLEGRK